MTQDPVATQDEPLLTKERLGARIRALRKARGLTLAQLHPRCGVPVATLSKIELGQIAASYEKLLSIAHALQVDIGALFDPADAPAPEVGAPRPLVVHGRPDPARRFRGPSYDYQLLATDYPQRIMTPMDATIATREGSPGWGVSMRHAGQEYLLVRAGSLRLHFETGDTLDLAEGESAYFDSGVGHWYSATSDADAEVLIVMTETAQIG